MTEHAPGAVDREVDGARSPDVRAHAELWTLAEEQRALRTVAELVAGAAPAGEVFAEVASQASGLLRGRPVSLIRFAAGSELVVEAAHPRGEGVGTRLGYAPGTVPDRVRRTATVVRVDDCTTSPDAGIAATFGFAAVVSAPVTAAGTVWGMLTATSAGEPLPPDTEHRLGEFCLLVGAALANIQSRLEVVALAGQQAALRSVAELAAQDVPAEQILGAVVTQASRLSGVGFTMLLRYEPDGASVIVALEGAPAGFRLGLRASADGDGSAHRVWRTGRPARVDRLGDVRGRWPELAAAQGFTTSAGVPIFLDGALWGALIACARGDPLPPAISAQLTDFAELTGSAIAAAQARRELRRLADEQAALLRVADAVAHGAPLGDVFDTVAAEASHLLGELPTALLRYDEPDVAVVIAGRHSPAPPGLRIPAHGGTPTGEVRRSARPVRVDAFPGTGLADLAERLGVVAGVAVPVVVEGRVWGALTTSSSGPPLPAGTEERLASFAELAAAAIANAENKAKLTASRARVVATVDETRRRIQRDVHDGAQQRLVHAILALKLAREELAADRPVGHLVAEALANAEQANRALRDVVRGILPAALTRGGLRSGLEELVADLPLPVELEIPAPRLAPAVETTAYFVVAEAVTNVIKHAGARHVGVSVRVDGATLLVEVRDDGVGGADPGRGTGLTGLLDRVEASGGGFAVDSPDGRGTTVRATLPIPPAGPAGHVSGTSPPAG